MEYPELDDVFSESWQNCALVAPVKKLNDEQIDFPRENSMLSPKNTASNEANIIASIKKEKLQSDLVLPKERLSIVIKTENDVNVDKMDDCKLEEDDYFIEESQNEVKFSPKGYVKTKPPITDSEEDELLSTFKISKYDEEDIKEEYFVESKLIVPEELDIKDEDETEDQSTAKSATGQTKKWHPPSNKTATLNRKSTHNRKFHLTEPAVFKCLDCTYQTDRKVNIAHHVLSHMRKTFECSHCSFKTTNKWNFSQHELIHVPKDQVKLHHCPDCSYTSIRKSGLTQHMLKHTKADDAIWYQCPECPHKTKRPSSLTLHHKLIHEKDAPMHKCTLCCYETIRKYDLTKHMLRVHIPKGIQPIRCQEEGCSYETHNKSNLVRHIKVKHECKRFFSCSKCSYQTKYANCIKEHELGHEEQSKWFSCTFCPYKTTKRPNLKKHMLVHKSGSEIEWFHCSECPYKSKYSISLKTHKLNHDLNPAKIFKCSECSFKTVRAHNLRAHRLVHEVSEWFFCYLCALRTTHKGSLVKHLRKMHRGSDGRINKS